MLIRRLKLEEGVTISKGKCILKPGYGLISPSKIPSETNEQVQYISDGRNFSGIERNNLTDNNLNKFYKPYLGK